MPCSSGTGSCCRPTSGSNVPFLPCISCVPEANCRSAAEGQISRDCRPLIAEHRALANPGTAYALYTPNGHFWDWAFGEEFVFDWLMTNESDTIWHRGIACDDRNEDGSLVRPCGTGAACCYSDCPEEPRGSRGPGEFGCLPYEREVCLKGYTIRLGEVWSFDSEHQFLPSLLFDRCRYRQPLSPFCSHSPSNTRRHAGAICRCPQITPPFMPQSWLDEGFSTCVTKPNDTRTWEEACELVETDDFPCRTRGFPLVIEPDGHAAFYGGHRKVEETAGSDTGCKHILAEPYVDSGGLFHSVGCTRFTDEGGPLKMIIGNLGAHQSIRCAAMYTDMGANYAFDCDN